MVLKDGITGFFQMSQRKSLPHIEMETFKKEVSGSLAQLGYRLLYFREAGVTPNFHLVVFGKGGERLGVICNSIYPVVALVKEIDVGVCELRYIEDENVENLIESNTSFHIVSTADLDQELTSGALKELNEAELRQINYWKPQTIGEVVFNWWD